MKPDTTYMIIGALLIGIAIGWLLAKMRVSGSFSASLTPSTGAGPVSTKFVRSTNLTLKCVCGDVQKFHYSSAGSAPESAPFPSGDSYTCPKCGKALDLTELRKVAREAGAPL
jgi:hypothetical protein